MKNKVLVLAGAVVLLLSFSAHSKEVFRASGLPNFNYDIVDGELSIGREYRVINESKILYGKTFPGGEGTDRGGTFKRFYLYDLDSRNSEVLLTTDTEDFFEATEGWQINTVGKSIYISVDGKLYTVDTTRGEATLVRDFGTFFCCNAGSTNSQIREMTQIAGIAYFVVYFDIDRTISYLEQPRKVALWRSDGTSSGTYSLTQAVDFTDRDSFPSTVFENTSYDAKSAFFLMNGSLFRINGNQIEEINNYDQATNVILDLGGGGVVQTSTGAFLCVGRDLSGNSGSELWHFGSDGGLTLVANGCRNLIKLGDNFLVSRDTGLWFYNSKTRSENLLVSGRGSHPSTNNCLIDNAMYISLENLNNFFSPNEIYKITPSGSTTKLSFNKNVPGDSLIVHDCLEDTKSMLVFSKGAFISSGDRSFFRPSNYFHFNTITKAELDINRVRFDDPSGQFRILNSITNPTDSVFVAARVPYLINLVDIPVLPFLELLLDE